MRTKLVFKVYGSNREDLVRRSNQVISDFLAGSDDSSIADIEMDVEALPLGDNDPQLFEADSLSSFVATVYVRLKFDK
jgi:hypothetical protein